MTNSENSIDGNSKCVNNSSILEKNLLNINKKPLHLEGLSVEIWQGRKGSNPGPTVLETFRH